MGNSGNVTITNHRMEEGFKNIIEKTTKIPISQLQQKVNEETVKICRVTKFYNGIDILEIEVDSRNINKCYANYNIFDTNVNVTYTPKGNEGQDETGHFIQPFKPIYCVAAKLSNNMYVNLGFIDRDNQNINFNHNGELLLQVGDNKISITDDRLNIMSNRFFINGLPFSEPEFENILDKEEVEERLFFKQDLLVSGENIKTVNNQSLLGGGNIDIQGGGSGDYPSLTGKPKINGVELLGDKSSSDLGIVIPTKTSDLVNDSGFITSGYHDNSKQDKASLDSDVSNLGYLKEHQSLSNYYTKSETDSAINSHHDSSKLDVSVITDYYKKSETDSLLANKADSVHSHSINDVTNLSTSLNGKVDKVNGKGLSTVDFTDTNYVHTDNNFTNSLKSKLNGLENYDDSEVRTLIGAKQDALVSGSNIKTINNTSLLGNGNINITNELVKVYDADGVKCYHDNNWVSVIIDKTVDFQQANTDVILAELGADYGSPANTRQKVHTTSNVYAMVNSNGRVTARHDTVQSRTINGVIMYPLKNN